MVRERNFFRHEHYLRPIFEREEKIFFSIKQFRRIVFKKEFSNFVSLHFIPLFFRWKIVMIYIYIELEQDIEEKASLGIWNNVINPFRDNDVEIILEEKLKSIEELLITESFKNKELEAI